MIEVDRPSDPGSAIPLLSARASDRIDEPLLSIRDLTVAFDTYGGTLRALDRVSFDVPKGRTVALVGESGCGKSVTAQAILRLLRSPAARIEGGAVVFEGRDLLTASERAMRAVRGGRIGMVFQEPMTSLNPVYTVGFQIAEALRLHRSMSRSDARTEAIDGLARVGFPDPVRRIDAYPHELSGGMRQRVLIAIALACNPALLIADEPTTALDTTVEAQILDLLATRKASSSMSMLLIAHDLAVVADVADEIVVLYAGVVVERGPAAIVLRAPAHPYTRALLRSLPPRTYRPRGSRSEVLPTIAGGLPDLCLPQAGCRFCDRCPEVLPCCRVEVPDLMTPPGSRVAVRCFLAHESGA